MISHRPSWEDPYPQGECMIEGKSIELWFSSFQDINHLIFLHLTISLFSVSFAGSLLSSLSLNMRVFQGSFLTFFLSRLLISLALTFISLLLILTLRTSARCFPTLVYTFVYQSSFLGSLSHNISK